MQQSYTNHCDKCQKDFKSAYQFATRCPKCISNYSVERASFARLRDKLPFKSFASFYKALGDKPEGCSLQKINNKWGWFPYAELTKHRGIKRSGDKFIAYARNKKVGEYATLDRAIEMRDKALKKNPLLG